MSATAINTFESGNDIILGKNLSADRRSLAFLSIVIVYFFYCYNFMVGTFVKPTMIAEAASGGFGFTLQQSETIFAVMSFGTIPGTIVFGILNAKIGKKYTLIVVASLIALTTFLPMMTPGSYQVWLVSRLITGGTLGGVFGCAMPLVTELFPQKYRGKLAAVLTSLFSLAMIFGGQLYSFMGDSNWQVLMYTAIIPPAVGAVMIFLFVPNDYQNTRQLNEVSKQQNEKISYLNMYKGKYLWIGLGVILLSGANFTAYSAFSNNATTYLRNSLGLSAAVAGGIYSLQGIGQLIGYNIWGFISDRFGRKKPLIGMALSAVFVFLFMRLGAGNITQLKLVSVFLGFAVGFSGAWGAYYTELFPQKFSALSSGISFNGGRIISTFAIPAIAGLGSAAAGMQGIFMVSMAVFVAGAVIWMFLPETYQKKEKAADGGRGKGFFGGGRGSFKKGKGSFGRNADNQPRKSSNPDVLYGRDFEDESVEILKIGDEIGDVVIRGRVQSVDMREIRNERTIFMFTITDFTDTIGVKIFVQNAEVPELKDAIKKGAFIKVKGKTTVDAFDHDLTVMSVWGIKKITDFRTGRQDTSPVKRVELHCHTKMSDMDGVTDAARLVQRAYEWGHPAIAITDHGVVQSFPEANHAIEAIDGAYRKKYQAEHPDATKDELKKVSAPFKVIYGMEAYLVDDLKDIVVNSKGQDIHGSYVVFDIETTGFSPVVNKIIEIGAVRVENGAIVDKFSTFVNPKVPIPFRIENLTGINDNMVLDAPDIETVLPKFLEFSEGAVMVAHNASFDMSFIEHNCVLQGIEREFTTADTVAMSTPHEIDYTLTFDSATLAAAE